MQAKTLLLAHLAKSAEGNAQQQEGDTNVNVPSTFLPTLEIPLPIFFLPTNPSALTIEKNSFFFADSRLINANFNSVLCTLGPGLWDVEYHHYLAPAGAVEDLTAAARLQIILVDGIGPTLELSYIANSKAIFQSNNGNFKILLSSEQNLSFNMVTNVGAGTGTNLSKAVIRASRFF